MNVAVYCGTRNLYYNMAVAAKSLLMHSNVDQIYFLIEDNEFPCELPPKTSIINISNQSYFLANGPNYKSHWTYMVLIRAALSKIFPNIDKILSLDVDTIVNENISSLWDIDLKNNYLAACFEPEKSTDTFNYINMGVVLFNLKKLREDKIDDIIINKLNTIYYPFNEQDCISEVCQQGLLELPADFNICNYTKFNEANHRKIIHYAAVRDWQLLPLITAYQSYQLNFNIQDIFNLDIIIPAYNDLEGLRNTLNSIPEREDIQITIVDDNSTAYTSEELFALTNDFPYIKIYRLSNNGGPGCARNFGQIRTNNKYIMFLDCGDILLPNSIDIIKNTISENSMLDIYQWSWINGEYDIIMKNSRCTAGFVYRREFLYTYGIKYIEHPIGSYSNEDIGFNHICFSILSHIARYDASDHYKLFDEPIYKMVYNKESLTHSNDNFLFSKHIPGAVINYLYVVKHLLKYNIDKNVILEEINSCLLHLYSDFLYCSFKHKNEFLQKNWEYLCLFYDKCYKYYIKLKNNEKYLMLARSRYIKDLLKYSNKPPNINRFISELQTCKQCPEHYYIVK